MNKAIKHHLCMKCRSYMSVDCLQSKSAEQIAMNTQATVSKTALPVRQYLEASVVPILMQVGPGLDFRLNSWLIIPAVYQRFKRLHASIRMSAAPRNALCPASPSQKSRFCLRRRSVGVSLL